ncbi:DUF4350 domain-containing protein [Microbacterium sp. BLY]|uniref:DUF4350 domain-containing protein n=1 Tax=Microbacterium sp. BLY TaxID=2823280 RepID=UPI001B320245|nr:DUF4350 domain-containing protein [Microbacterium sp. BLY]MBP3977991.1 DUF4350 domain-containing protein [Microbacterium sp. BLY]
MTTTAASDVDVATAERPRRRAASLGGWLLIAVLVLAVALAASQLVASAPGARGTLDPESRADTGALALAEILRDQGIEVDVVRSRAEAAAAVDEDSTLALTNPVALSDDALAALLAPADRIVFLSTSTHLLSELGVGENASGSVASASADCAVPAFAEVGRIRPDRLFSPAPGVTGCFGDGDAAAVLVDDRDGHRSVVEGVRLFSNATLADDGNAALALALLGQTERVVWYVPSWEDTDIPGTTPDTLGSLTPEWVTPAILLLLAAGIAIAAARGRRFGPLVAETLPVTVRASETMHGRARLTAKAADAPHAAEALRDGTRRRLARRLGLAVNAGTDEVADAAADRLRVPRGSLQSLLSGPPPADDAALVAFARRLDDLETAVEGTLQTPPGET